MRISLVAFLLVMTTAALANDLVTAAGEGKLRKVERLISKGANVNTTNFLGETPVIVAAANGHELMVRYLLAEGANANARDKAGGSPLDAAAFNGHFDIAKMLITAGANIKGKDSEGNTILVSAVFANDVNFVRFLLRFGADVNERAGGKTPLMIAAQLGFRNLVTALIQNGADLNATSREGKTAMQYAKQKRHLNVMRVLKRAGAK